MVERQSRRRKKDRAEIRDTVGMPVLSVGATIEHPNPPSLRGLKATSADASPLAATIAANAAGLRRMSSSKLMNTP